MAASGNFVNDLLEKISSKPWTTKTHVLVSQLVTLVVGAIAIILALQFTTVLSGILHAYAFMVSGLTIPTLGAFFWTRSSSSGAIAAMLAGGGLTSPPRRSSSTGRARLPSAA